MESEVGRRVVGYNSSLHNLFLFIPVGCQVAEDLGLAQARFFFYLGKNNLISLGREHP